MTTNTPLATGTLQMIRAEVSVGDFQRWMGTRRLQDPDHAMHCLLTECFGDLAPKPFRLIVPRGGSTGCLYGYGPADSGALRDAASICADPLQSRILPTHTMDSKPMPLQWRKGKRLGFEVRVRPIVRKSRGSGNEEAERDIFQVKAETFPRAEMPYSREQVYTEWLSDKLESKGGARLEPEKTTLAAFQRTRAVRKLHYRDTEGPEALMRGILTVTDSDAFTNLLAQGIGRHRAYGYGMLLLRPARG